MSDTLRVAMIGHGFMGAAHSQGWRVAPRFFPLPFRPEMTVLVGRRPEAVAAAAETWGWAETATDWREVIARDDIDVIDIVTPGDSHAEIAIEAMEAGIPVINVDREFSSPFAARTTILGDNYGMGVSAGTYICEQLGGEGFVAEIAGIDSLPLTQDRSRGFADALSDCGLEVNARVAADFTVAGGEAAASQLLAANPQIDAIWNHDDDQGVGVLAAIEAAGRDEFFTGALSPSSWRI